MKLKKVQDDVRGRAYSITDKDLGCEELVIFFTKKGYARGGCVHYKNDEHFVVINGNIEATGVKNNFIPKGTPHYFFSRGDSVVMEWGATSAEKKNKYKPYRDVVEDINATNRTEVWKERIKSVK